MPKLQEEILSSFLDRLANSPHVKPEMIDQLKKLFSHKTKPKVDDLVKIFAPPPSGEVK